MKSDFAANILADIIYIWCIYIYKLTKLTKVVFLLSLVNLEKVELVTKLDYLWFYVSSLNLNLRQVLYITRLISTFAFKASILYRNNYI